LVAAIFAAVFSVQRRRDRRGAGLLFGYDDEMNVWAAQHRPFIVLVLVLSAITYAMYDWLEEDRG
jgi:hypothetical protein